MLGVAGDIGHQALADWAALIKRDLEGIVWAGAIKGVSEPCPRLTSGVHWSLSAAPLAVHLRRVRLTLTAHGQLAECLASAF